MKALWNYSNILGKRLRNRQYYLLFCPVRFLFERRKHWGKGEGHTTIHLSPLSHEQSESLVAEVLKKVDNVPNALRKLIIENAEGNPYYIEEMIRMLVEDGIIIKDEPTWHIQPNRLNNIRIPSTLTGIIQSRLDSLPKQERSALQQAAVVGRVFWDTAIGYINSNQLQEIENLSLNLDSLQSREMIFQQQPSTFTDAAEYIFKHGIFREVTYETVLLRQRKKYHGLVADWLIEQHKYRVLEISSVIAEHLVKAGRSSEAIDYLQKAAEIAAAKYANEEAASLYQKAFELTQADAVEKRYFILKGLESVWNLLGDRKNQESTLKNLEAAAALLTDQDKNADVLIRKAWYLFAMSDFPGMLEVAQQAITLSEKIKDPGLTQEALYAVTWAYIQLENFDKAEERALQSLEMNLASGNRLGEGNVHNVLGMIGIARGNYAEARDHVEKFLQIAPDTENQNRELSALSNLATILITLGDYGAAKEFGTQMVNLALEIGDRVAESSAYINLAWGASTQGEWKTANEYLMNGLLIKREMYSLEAVAEGLLWLGHTKLGLQQPKDAEQAFRESIKIRQELEQEILQAEAISGLCETLLAPGDLKQAQELVETLMGFISRDANLSGSWEPLRIYWTCYQVFKEANDPRKDEIIKKAFNNLQARAAKIPDLKAREHFLEKIPWHRDIMLTSQQQELDIQE